MPHLNFKGKVFVQNHHLAVPYHELTAVKSKGLSPKASLHDNLIVQGDNLKALKALLPTYHNKVKCIYIDPPYNTGNIKTEKWKYSDNINSPMHQEWFGQVISKEDLTRHDKWCCMMMPRLRLLRELLSDDGVIMVSIDDHEQHHLKCLLDEVFGEENFVAQLVWEKGRKNDAKLFSVGHEYMLVYARSMTRLRELKTVWREEKPGAREFWDKYIELKSQYEGEYEVIESELKSWLKELSKDHPSTKLQRYCHIDEHGPWRDRDISWPGGDGPRYDLTHPKTGKLCKVPDRGWGFSTIKEMDRQIQQGLVVFRETHDDPPFRKKHLKPISDELNTDEEDEPNGEEDIEVGMQVMGSVFYKQSQVTVKYFNQIFGKKVFNNPKDFEVLSRIFSYVTNGDKNAVFMDSFAGSGTTAHAVLALNKEDGGNRRFVSIECEDYADTITAERVRRVIKGVPKAKDENLKAGLGGTFSYFKLGKELRMDAILESGDLPTFEALAAYIFFTATGEEFDPKQIKKRSGFIGESRLYDVFLIYQQDADKLMDLALTLDMARQLPSISGKQKLVFAPTRYVDPTFLDHLKISFQQLPFQIYRALEGRK
jgi:adenine-specific DNA-methyltransferase